MRRPALALVVALAAAACTDQPTALTRSTLEQPQFSPGQSGAALQVSSLTATICSNGGTLTVSGTITVLNSGAVATQGLLLSPQVQFKGKGPFQDLAGAVQAIAPAAQLDAGASQAYAYSITFAPVAGAQYRLSAAVTITNHSGSLGTPKGPTPKIGFGAATIPNCVTAPNTPPTVAITAPASGSAFFQGVIVNVAGTASDAEDGSLSAAIVWSSDINGTLATGAGFATNVLAVGTHTITASVTDNDGAAAQTSITLVINPAANATPTVTITAPANGASFNAGVSVNFTGTAVDPEDGNLSAALVWSSNITGFLGTGASVNSSALTAGTHTITATVTDALGATGSAAISVTINATGVTCGGTLTAATPVQVFSQATLDAVAGFETIVGLLFVQANDVLVDVTFPCLKTVTGGLGISNNRAMVQIAFPQLIEVGTFLTVISNPILTSARFPVLQQLGAVGSVQSTANGVLAITNNPALANLEIPGVTIHRNVVPSQLGGLQLMQPLALTNLSGISNAISVDSLFFTLPPAGQPGLTRAQFEQYKNAAPLVRAVCELPFGAGGTRVCL